MSKLTLKKTTPVPPPVRQSRLKRDWMDNTYKKHAYHCMPMTVANVYGWEMVLENDVVVKWSGGNTVPEIVAGAVAPSGRTVASASIIGMVSFHMGWVISTEKNISCWFSGSPNYVIEGAFPLTATVPTWWWPDEFQMNWMITKPGEEIVFKAGTPFCFFFPYNDEVVPSIEVEIADLYDDKDLVESRIRYNNEKSRKNTEEPWIWTKGIKTGVDSDGKRIGPTFTGLPRLSDPMGQQSVEDHQDIW